MKSEPSAQGQHLVRQRCVKVIGYVEKPVVLANEALRPGVDRNQLRDRLAGPGDHDLLAASDAQKQPGQMSLRFMNVDLSHGHTLD